MKVGKLLTGLALAATMLLAMLSPGSAFAQGGYIGASAGTTDADVDCAGTTNCDTKDTGFKVFGGYMVTPNIGFEVSYIDLGKATATVFIPGVGNANGRFESNGLALFAVGAAPIDNFVLFGKLGVAALDTELTISAGSGSASDSQSSTTVAFGLGAAYHFTKNFGVRFEWERFQPKFEGEKADVDVLSIGVQWRF